MCAGVRLSLQRRAFVSCAFARVRTMCTLGVHTVHGVFAPQARCGVVDRENGAPEDAVCADVRSDADSITIVARDAKEVTRCHCLFGQAKD